MRKFLSINYSDGSFNFAMLLLRVGFAGMLLINHGMVKLMNFSEVLPKMYNFLGMGQKASLVLIIFAEVFCSLFVILGLFTRLMILPLIIAMLVAIFGAHRGASFGQIEPALSYLIVFLVLLFCGPGRISVDGMMKK